VEEEHTHKYFLSGGDPLHGGVVGTVSPWCWAPLLAPLLFHFWFHDSRCVALLNFVAVLGELASLPVIEAWVASWCRLLWCPE
jgi:hypothetical protein